jgi:outer membrane protein TolC
MRVLGGQYVWSLLRVTLVLAVVLPSSSTVARAQVEAQAQAEVQASFEEILLEVLAQRKGAGDSGVESIVAKMLEKQVTKEARRLDVWQCMSLALDQNKLIEEAWHLLQQTQVGDRIITRSRLFPQLELIVNRTETDSETTGDDFNDTQTSLSLRQRILEFGKDSPAEVSLRASQRSALYNLESTVRSVLSQIRQGFYDILLREQQIQTRMELLRRFREDWEKKKQRFKLREGWREPDIEPSAVLQAEANVMNELGSINSLLRQQARSKIALLQVMGEPIGQSIEIEGKQDETIFDVEQAVQIALENSIEVARLEEEVEEQERVVRQLIWEFAPEVNLQTGVSRRGEDASLNVSNSNDTWAVDVAGERFVHLYDEPDMPGTTRNERFELNDDEDFFLDLDVRVPILEGFARVGRVKRERSRLRQAEARLQRAREIAELNVRQRYESLLDVAMNVQLQAHERDISRHLFDIQSELRDKLPTAADEDTYETFRNRFFRDQSSFFSVQSSFIGARENLREAMGFFE